jgi:hypothetical protein
MYNVNMPYQEPAIDITNLPLGLIPDDTPAYLTDRTWDDILQGLYSGVPMTKTLREIGCDEQVYGRVMKWINDDETRHNEYLKAKEIGCELMADEMLAIADEVIYPNGLPTDVQRAKLQIDTRKYLLGANNKKRFGAEKAVIVNNVNLLTAMDNAEKRTTGEVVG